MHSTEQSVQSTDQDERTAQLTDRLDRAEVASVLVELSLAERDVWKSVVEGFANWLARPEVQAGFRRFQKFLEEANARVEAVDAPGYTPYLERLGHTGFSARLHAGLIHHFAKKLHAEAGDHRIALSAFHDLAKRPRWHPALARQVERFRAHCWNADFLNDAFRDAGCPELKQKMLDLVDRIRGGDVSCGPVLLAILARVAPHAPSPRGRPPLFETVLHETFLRWTAEPGKRQAYTYGPVPGSINPDSPEDFIDAATAATRTELRRPTFNPIAARRAQLRHPDRDVYDPATANQPQRSP